MSSQTMQAVLLDTPGGPEALRLGQAARPVPGPGQVLVRIAAASVNPVDTKIRAGLPIGPSLPGILGCDLAGTVAALGEGVTGFAPGDAVYGCAGGVKGQGGTLAEFIAADARLLAPKPASLSMREAAALPLVTITAWQAVERSGVGPGDHVLVHGGTGGVGHVALQLARARGARVATTISSAAAAELARGLGAEDLIDRKAEDVPDYVARLTGGRGFDVVIDTVGGSNLDKSFAAAALNGRVAATAARSTHDLSPLHAKGLSLHVVFMLIPMLHDLGREAHGAILRQAASLADAGQLKPLLDDSHFTLEQAGEAHRRLEAGEARGKIVIEIA